MKQISLQTLVCSVLVIVASLFCLQVKAYNLRGKVVDSSNKEALVGAGIKIKTDSVTILLQTQTDAYGNFSLSNLSNENITIEVSCVGYAPFSTDVVGNKRDLNIGIIALKPRTATLNEVTVKGSKRVEQPDKYLVFPTEQELKKTSEAIELLNVLKVNMPGLKVNEALQTLHVEGGTPVLLINGKEVELAKIQSLDHRRIQRIEYSNTPNIRYLDRGATGFINFIINPAPNGGSAMISTNNALTTLRNRENVSASYHHGKSELTLSYNTLWRKSKHEHTDKNERFVGRPDDIVRLQTGLPSSISDFDNNLTLDYTYMHSPSTMLTAMLGLKYHDKNDKNIYHISEQQGVSKTEFERHYNNDRNLLTPSLDLFFKTALKNNQTLELNAVGTMSTGDYNRGINDGVTYSQGNITKNKSSNISGEALYTIALKPLTAKVGISYTHAYAQNNYSENGTTAIIDKLTKNNAYGYVIVTGSIKKFGYNLGLGIKHYNTADLNNSKNFFNAKTTVSLNYPLNKMLSVGYLFLLDSSLPPLSAFSNVVQTIDNVSLQMGNLNVKPSVLTRNRLSINLNSGGLYASLQSSYNYTRNPIIASWKYISDATNTYYNKFIRRTENGYNDSRINMECSVGWQNLFGHLTLQTVMGWDKYRLRGDNYNHSFSKPYASASVSAYWKKFSVYANFDILPQYSIWGTNVYRGVKYNYVGVRYNIKHWAFGCRIDNMFSKRGFVDVSENVSNVNPTHTEYRIADFANMVEVSVQYRIKYGKEYKKTNRTLMNRGFDPGVNADY